MRVAVENRFDTTYYSSAEDKEYRVTDNETEPETCFADDNDVLHLRLTCDHVDYYWSTAEVDTMRNGEHDTYKVPVAICANPDCGKELDIEPSDPDE